MLRLALAFGFILVTWTALTTEALADTTAPVTSLTLEGDTGNEDWYLSTVDVAFRASDLESSPTSITYQIDSHTPVVSGFQTSPNAIINSSMESGNFITINNWHKGPGDESLLWQSYLPAKYGYRSAAVASAADQYHYWFNRDSAVPATAGNTYTAQSWITTLDVAGSNGAWLEVWAMDSTDGLPDAQLGQSDNMYGNNDWQLLSVEVTLPTGYDRIFVKLGSQADTGIVWYDGVSLYNGTDLLVSVLPALS